MRPMPPSMASRNTVWYVFMSLAKNGPVGRTTAPRGMSTMLHKTGDTQSLLVKVMSTDTKHTVGK